MASKYSIETIFKAIDKFTAPVTNMTKSGNKFSKILKTDFAKAQRSVQKFAEGFKTRIKQAFQIGIGIAIAGMTMLAKKGIESASDLVEVQNVVDATFLDNANSINEWSKTAIEQYGLSELQAKQYSSTIGAMMKASGITGNALSNMSIDIASLTGDIVSFSNLEPDEVFEKLKSIVTGTTKPMTELGIVMNVANLEAFALEKGITKSWKQMTQAERVQLRYNYVMAKTIDMQGDYNKTMKTSLANQLRTLRIKFFDKLSRAMAKLIPLLIKGAEYLRGLLDKIDEEKLATNIEKGALAIINFGKGIINLIKFLKPISPLIALIIASFIGYKLTMIIAAIATGIFGASLNALPIFAVITAISLLIIISILLIKHWKQVIAFTTKWWDKLKGILFVLFPMWRWVMILIEAIRLLVKHWGAVKEAFSSKGILAGLLEIGKILFSAILSPIQSLLELLSHLPKVGKKFQEWGINIKHFREGMFETQSPITQGERYAYSKQETVQRGELTIKDKTNRAELKPKFQYGGYNIKLQKSGTF